MKKKTSLLLMLLLVFSLFSAPAYAAGTIKTIPSSAVAKTTAITISAAGDCTLGVDTRYYNTFNQYYQQNNAAYFLKNVKSVFSKDSLTICNFEGTLTNSSQRANKSFTFKGPASYAKILTSGSVEVVNLANNHSMDYGYQGFVDTKSALSAAKIPYCIDSTIAWKKVKGVKVAFLGFNCLNGVSYSTVKSMIKTARDKGASIVIVSFHWGIELDTTPNTSERDMGHYAIDQGADLVLGHHPHILQGVEKYKKKYIVYSLGNFCFGGNTNPRDKDTMIYQQTFYVNSKTKKLTSKTSAKVIPCSLSSVSYTNNYQPTILKGSEKTRVMQKINNLSQGLNTSADSNGKLK